MRTRGRGERGATALEAALAIPLLLLLFAGLADVGLVVLGSSVGSNAAREGARVGIIDYEDADDTSSTAFGAIDDAVRARLVGWISDGDGDFVTVRCLDGDDPDVAKPCDEAVVVDHDLIEVAVSWRSQAGPGLFPVDRTHRDVARMVITGGGAGSGAGPTGPVASEVGFDPTSYTVAETDASGAATLTLRRGRSDGIASVNVATVAGTAGVPTDLAELTTTVSFGPGEETATVAIEIVGDDVAEPSETFTVVLSDPIGVTLSPSASVATVTITDDDTAPPTCTTATLASATVPVRVNGQGRVNQASSFTVLIDTTRCGAPQTATILGGQSGSYAAPVAPTSCNATSCTWTIARNDSPWTTGTKDLRITAGGQTFLFDDVVRAT